MITLQEAENIGFGANNSSQAIKIVMSIAGK